MRFRLDPFSPSGVSVAVEQAVIQQPRQSNAYVVNKATGLIGAGTNVTITGNGTTDDPYLISASGGGGGGGGSGDSIVASDGSSSSATAAADAINITATDGIHFTTVGNTAHLRADNLNATREIQLPDGDGILVTDGQLAYYVRYVGATQDLDLGTYNLDVGQYVTGSASNGLIARAADQVNGDTDGAQAVLRGADGNGIGAGGPAQLTGGTGGATDGNGGDVYLTPGVPTGAGAPGKIRLQDPISAKSAIFDTTGLSADHTLTLPNSTGTVTLNTNTAVMTHKDLTDATNTFPTFNQNTTGSAATLTTARTIDGQSFNGSTNITVIAPGTHAATSKATPVDADELPIVDSAASNVLKKLTWANLKATAKTYFDTLYQTVLVSGTNIKTINGTSVLGSGDIAISSGSSPTFTMPTITKTLETATAGSWTAANSGTGTISNDSRRALLTPGTTANSLALMYWDWSVSNSWNVFQGTVQFGWVGWMQSVGSDFDSFIGVGDVGPTGTSMGTMTNRHFGFRRKRTASGAMTLICTNADSTTETTTTVTDPGTTTNCFFGAVKTSTDIKYYVNGSLVATHTTNIPNGFSATQPMEIAICNANVGVTSQLYTLEYTYQQQY